MYDEYDFLLLSFDNGCEIVTNSIYIFFVKGHVERYYSGRRGERKANCGIAMCLEILSSLHRSRCPIYARPRELERWVGLDLLRQRWSRGGRIVKL